MDRVAAVISNQTQLMTALTQAYVEERERLSRFREQDLDDFFQLLSSDDAMGHALEARARTLGIPLDEPRAIAVFGPRTSTGSKSANVGPVDFRRELAVHMPETQIWVGRAPEGFVALLPQEPDPEVLAANAERLLGDDGRVGVGGPGRDIVGLRRSAREALRALEIGALLGPAKRAHRYADLAILDLVGIGSADAEEFMRGVLGPLALTGASRTYLETLRQLSANGYRLKLAAAALSIHPHTLSYRVKQIRRHFDIDLEDPEVRLRVHLALLILDAQGSAPTPPDPAR